MDEKINEDTTIEPISAKAKLLDMLNSKKTDVKKEIAVEAKKKEDEKQEIKSMNIFENLINIMEAK